jgi:hypothetical protein
LANTNAVVGLAAAAVGIWYLHDRYNFLPTLHLPQFPFIHHAITTPTAQPAPTPPVQATQTPKAPATPKPPQAPGAPSLVRTGISQGKAFIVIKWPATSNATRYEVVHYGGQVVATTTGTTATIFGLSPGSIYTLGIRACNSAGCSPVQAYTQFQLPKAG